VGNVTALIERFIVDGFLVVRGAVDTGIVQTCVASIDDGLRVRGIDPHDPATWTKPVVRFSCPEGPAFAAAGTSPAICEVYDDLLGPDGWIRRPGVGGQIPVRFPSAIDPGDAGWHFDGSYDVGGQWWANVRSRGRALLALFLFTDVGEHDAPTEILVGSHLDVPRLLLPFGERGIFHGDVELQRSTFRRRSVRATGRAGDVYVCHPFLVHRATWPHLGTGPRMLAQPAIDHHHPFGLRDDVPVCAVERAILHGLRDVSR
jgi:hypothetical protein